MLGDMALEPVLKEFRFTSGFPEHHLAKLAALGREAHFEANQLILLTGQRSRQFYLVTGGSVCVEARTPVYTVCVQALGPGDAFGWSSLLTHHDTLFQVRAREATSVICWDGWQLGAACEEDPEFGRELYRRVLELVAGRVRGTEARLAEFCGIARPISERGCRVPAR
jgi:CRP/FNR family transcriptional regulator, cyclic AMP receptor protein